MAFRFRRSMTLLPGLRLNFGKSGLSLSVGRRGASITVGSRGTFANVGIPGTGLSYRARLDVPQQGIRLSKPDFRAYGQAETRDTSADRTFHGRLRDLLRDRERGPIDWKERALWLATPDPGEENEDAYEDYVRRVAAGRFARRMAEGDRAAWSEVVREELLNEDLPVCLSFEWAIEEETDRIYVGVVLPSINEISIPELKITKMRELHEDVCCALLLRIAHEIFRVIPDVQNVYLVGFRTGKDPATGFSRKEMYLRLATDRESLTELLLDDVDPSSAFEFLGGVGKRRRGELQIIGVEPIE